MVLQCLAVLRTVRASTHDYVKHAVHRFVRHHMHHSGHWIAHEIVAPATVRVAVCTLAGLGAIGIGSATVMETRFHSHVPGKSDSPAILPLTPVSSGTGSSAIAWIRFDPGTADGMSDPPIPLDASVIVGSDPSPFNPAEGGDLIDPLLFLDYSADGVTDQLPPSEPAHPGFSSDPSGSPTTVPEPASTTVLAVALLRLAVCRRKLTG